MGKSHFRTLDDLSRGIRTCIIRNDDLDLIRKILELNNESIE
jgi:hypothetical protein